MSGVTRDFNFIAENGLKIISINSIGFKTEIVELIIELSKNAQLTVYVDTKRIIENCCSFTKFDEIKTQPFYL